MTLQKLRSFPHAMAIIWSRLLLAWNHTRLCYASHKLLQNMDSLGLSWYSFVFMVQRMNFMFSCTTINDSVWVQCFYVGPTGKPKGLSQVYLEKIVLWYQKFRWGPALEKYGNHAMTMAKTWQWSWWNGRHHVENKSYFLAWWLSWLMAWSLCNHHIFCVFFKNVFKFLSTIWCHESICWSLDWRWKSYVSKPQVSKTERRNKRD